MKTFLSIGSLAITLLILGNCQSGPGEKQTTIESVKMVDTMQVYYFHLTHRCNTCRTVESEAEKSLVRLYPQAVKERRLTYQALNFEEEKNKQLIEKLEVGGQSLLFVAGSQVIDLTTEAFLYAVDEPSKLREIVKETVDTYLNQAG